MRTTIELSEDHREKLRLLALERGDRGFSQIIETAIDLYLNEINEESRRERGRRALEALEAISPETGEHLAAHVTELRSRWRQS